MKPNKFKKELLYGKIIYRTWKTHQVTNSFLSNRLQYFAHHHLSQMFYIVRLIDYGRPFFGTRFGL